MDNEYINAQRWEDLIATHMPHLRIFDIQHKTSLFGNIINGETCQDLMNRFATLFWTKRKWFFTHQLYYLDSSNYGVFYSIQPYSANEITFGKNLWIFRDLIMNISNSMISLSQITKITINSEFICFSNIIKMLCSIPNCKELMLTSLSLERIDSSSLQCTEDFQSLSHTNNITNITIKSCDFKRVQLLVNLFPRLQHLHINELQQEFQSIIKYLLNTNENTRYLHSLFIRSISKIWIKKRKNIITEIKQQNDVSVKLPGDFGCYFWWK
ncbi:unnamed protein product [Adineta steineri]|nr:unnamed protein product [Adineta steineri]CAF4182605.1 unnamed protein product [Adineta steineri]